MQLRVPAEPSHPDAILQEVEHLECHPARWTLAEARPGNGVLVACLDRGLCCMPWLGEHGCGYVCACCACKGTTVDAPPGGETTTAAAPLPPVPAPEEVCVQAPERATLAINLLLLLQSRCNQGGHLFKYHSGRPLSAHKGPVVSSGGGGQERQSVLSTTVALQSSRGPPLADAQRRGELVVGGCGQAYPAKQSAAPPLPAVLRRESAWSAGSAPWTGAWWRQRGIS